MESDLNISSLQNGVDRKAQSDVTPVSCSWFPLSSSSLRWDGFVIIAEARREQLTSDKLQDHNLRTDKSFFSKALSKSKPWKIFCSCGLNCCIHLSGQHYI